MTTVRAPLPLRTRPLVSVVVPHYNYGQYLPTSVGSVLAQEGVDVEVIVVDDTSTDGSVAVAREIAASDPRVRLVEHEQNMRHIRTYNDGLGRANGDYVVLLSADDALAPGALARAAALLEHDRRISLVYGLVTDFDGVPPAFTPARSWWTVWEGEQWVGHVARRGRNIPTNPEVVMRRSVYDAIGGYVAALPQAADMYMWLQAAARGRIGRVNGPVQAYYRQHDANMHNVQFGGNLDNWRSVLETFDLFFREDGHLLRRPDRLRARADAAVAREVALASTLLPPGPDGAEHRAQLLRLAREADPAVVRSPAWQWARLAGRAEHRSRLGVEAVESLRWKVRGQLLARFGT
ncbi:glycosyltransferase family 2 protein [Promicromonospora sp. NPDC059942]|uniref:glycosyltransferase family 2 protein n=1 Tax=Promicromonospora sp. NPDC059942 TaxID=3347009 RepID=UPI0036656592